MWQQQVYQVKLSLCFDINVGNIGDEIITVGQTNDHKIGKLVIGMIPEDALGIMDRGFASWKLIDEMCDRNTLFIVRIRNNMKLNPNSPNARVVQIFLMVSNRSRSPASGERLP
ncbi:MAG: transposase [Pseudanabaenaceae cyanobacterium]